MEKNDSMASVLRAFSNQGMESRAVPFSRLREARAEVLDVLCHASGPGLMKYIEACYDLRRDEVDGMRSVVVAAVPSPAVRFRLEFEGSTVDALVPPTYLDYPSAARRIEAVLDAALGPGNHYKPLRAPLKLIATRSGLAEYGRNNITYVGRLGSYARLAAYATDVPCEEGTWRERRAMAKCERCDLCARRCPTGAIDRSRFLLNAERCLTFLNEEEADMPEWVSPDWHHCLVGCLRCQEACPANREASEKLIQGPSFDDEETSALTSAARAENLPPGTRKKVENSGLSVLYPILPRNVRLLLDGRRR